MSPVPSGESVLNQRVHPVLSHLRAASGGRVRCGDGVLRVGVCWVLSGLPEVRSKFTRSRRVSQGYNGRKKNKHTCRVSSCGKNNSGCVRAHTYVYVCMGEEGVGVAVGVGMGK